MIGIYAAINSLGYGVHAQNIIKALIDSDTDINLTKIGQVQNDPYFESYWQMAEKNLDKFNAKDPSVYIFHDEFSNQACGSPLAVFSVFEGTKLKPRSKHMLQNGPANIVLTTTHRHAELLKENGITKPVHVVPEGVDDALFNTIPTSKHIDTGKFTFITAGKLEKRKCTSDIVRTFMSVSEGKEVALIAHTFNPFMNRTKDHPFKNLGCWIDFDPSAQGFQYKGWNGKAHVFSKDKADIYFTAPSIQTAEMACLYHSANVGIAMSRAEGWNLCLGELLACGLPSIATRCLGHAEYLTSAPPPDRPMPQLLSELVIEPQGQELAEDGLWFKGDQGDWDKPSTAALREKMEMVLGDTDKYTAKSDEISDYMTNSFSWNQAADKLKEILSLY